ncbi:MAG: MBL fold metallo-hydrolase [Candidatus Bathyarchaeota archaeon]|nr:MBL fold metallo-hydrolase [Candidatus Bathyarchaeota archaeon]
MPQIQIRAARKIEIVSLVDNSVDLLSANDKKQVLTYRRWNTASRKEGAQLPMGEHGFALLIKIYAGKPYTILFDTGVSSDGVVTNALRMGLDLGEVDWLVLSHGHYDHCGGLQAAVQAINNPDLQIIAHENMFKLHGSAMPNGTIREHKRLPNPEQLNPCKIITTKHPSLIADGCALVTGEIPRKTSFETGNASNRILENNKWQPDPALVEERALVFDVAGKGLVVVSGCAHAGIINTLRYAQQLTDRSVYAVLGGFHLAGQEYEKRIAQTVEELKDINPALIVASHCTGWKAIQAIAQALPEAFAWGSVGNRYQIE